MINKIYFITYNKRHRNFDLILFDDNEAAIAFEKMLDKHTTLESFGSIDWKGEARDSGWNPRFGDSDKFADYMLKNHI